MTAYPKRAKSLKRHVEIFTSEIIERDARQIDVVEINFKDATAQVVQDSDAPKLTKKVLKEKGAPIQTGKTTFDGAAMEVDMYHGVGLDA